MIAVVTGGSASGKSAFAERLACTFPEPRAYVATMRHGDGETEARIARHLKMREGKGFITVELADLAESFSARRKVAPPCREDSSNGDESAFPAGSASALEQCRTALLEDLGNLVANGLEDQLESVLACENVVIVANEVGGDGVAYDSFTMDYIEQIGALACKLAARADVVVEVVAGVPNVVKGGLPCAC